MSQRELANWAGLSRITIIRLENDIRLCSLSECDKIAAALNISPSNLHDDYLTFVSDNFGCTIKRLRKDLYLTQGQFALQLGVTKKTVVCWESEKHIPSRKTFDVLLKLIV